MHAGALQRLERDEVGHVDAERLAGQPALAQLVRDPLAEPVGNAGLDGHRTAHRRDAGAEVLRRKPGREQLVVARRRAEVRKPSARKNFYCYQTFLIKRGWSCAGHARLNSNHNALLDRFKKMQVYAGGALADFWFSKRGVGGRSRARAQRQEVAQD